MAIQLIMVPGLGNSGPQHWQSLWEAQDTAIRRVGQSDWDTPTCAAWVKKLHEEIQQADAPVVLVAHSLGCLAVVHWARHYQGNVKAAMLVAPPDAERPDFPQEATGFAPIPQQKLPFPTIVVASSNDPYISMQRVQELGRNWGSQLVSVGDARHINASSGLGDWPQGQQLLQELL
ncbi:RBBP9/YdeN family alpha/beta hydrolase [Pontibacter liquoris]|uniref:RBBP9/YdeN family alpha/beta hydrolase n=1 Tax=Pontibacter liquoris TaxID=2905677 RepID=UPI001FA6C1A9|nr:alpha/beta fold hydrolase [Pontibacter liquoris]